MNTKHMTDISNISTAAAALKVAYNTDCDALTFIYLLSTVHIFHIFHGHQETNHDILY